MDQQSPDPLATERRITRWLETALRIPGTQIRFGADALLGLIPGVGDAAGALLSGWLIVKAARQQAPASLLGQMLGNVLVDALVGVVPLLGDLFDIGFRANTRNLRLLEQHLGIAAPEQQLPAEPPRRRRKYLLALLGLIALLALAAYAYRAS